MLGCIALCWVKVGWVGSVKDRLVYISLGWFG
jgi:hypothetical protein